MNRSSKDRLRLAVVTSIHLDFDARIWKHARSLADHGCDVHLVCPWAIPHGEVRQGVTFHTFKRVRPRPLRPFLIPPLLGRRLLPLLREVDIIHFHDIDILPWMALLSLFKVVVYDVHENYPDEMLVRDWIPRWLRTPLYHVVGRTEILLAKIIRNCVLVAPSQNRRFSLTRLRSIHIRNYATDRLLEDIALNYQSRDNVVVFTGAHHDNNGSLLLLEIASRALQRRLSLKFLVTDRFVSESFRRRFSDEIDRRGLTDQVAIHPFVPAHDIMRVLNQATIAISPNLRVASQEMGVHTKLYEYMAAGLPIIATDLPMQREAIEGACAGILAQPEEPETFVSALATLVADRRYAYELGLNGQQAFRRQYCWESQVPALIRFYNVLLADPAAALEPTKDAE